MAPQREAILCFLRTDPTSHDQLYQKQDGDSSASAPDLLPVCSWTAMDCVCCLLRGEGGEDGGGDGNYLKKIYCTKKKAG